MLKYLKSEKHGTMPVYGEQDEAEARKAGFTEEVDLSAPPAESAEPKKRGRPKKAE
jgi:hypothetical protein